MPYNRQPEQQFPVRLTQARRKAVAEIVPELADRLNLEERNQRTVTLSPAELNAIQMEAGTAARQGVTGAKRNSLRHVLDFTTQAIERSQGFGAIPSSVRVYQVKITLMDTHPPVCRRNQVRGCTLDKLHEHVQTAMGWMNSHLNHFRIGGGRIVGLGCEPLRASPGSLFPGLLRLGLVVPHLLLQVGQLGGRLSRRPLVGLGHGLSSIRSKEACRSRSSWRRDEPDGHRILRADVPGGINAGGKRLRFHKEAGRRRPEVEAEGRAKPALHLFTSDGAAVPVAEELRGAAVPARYDLRTVAAPPGQFGVGALERFVAEGKGEPLAGVRDRLGLDQPGDHFRHAQDERLFLQAGARVVKDPGWTEKVRINGQDWHGRLLVVRLFPLERFSAWSLYIPVPGPVK
jgi:hypothetical protein